MNTEEQSNHNAARTGQAAHTPTPWNLHRRYDGELMAVPASDGLAPFVAATLRVAQGDKIIADVLLQAGARGGWPMVESEAEFRANAELIVRAVNEYASDKATIASLVAALEDARQFVEKIERFRPQKDMIRAEAELYAHIRAALADAKGGQP